MCVCVLFLVEKRVPSEEETKGRAHKLIGQCTLFSLLSIQPIISRITGRMIFVANKTSRSSVKWSVIARATVAPPGLQFSGQLI